METWKEILIENEIPPRFVNMDFKTHPVIKPRWNEILKYAKKPIGNISMFGPCGTGKTITAISIFATHVFFHGRGARFFNSETLYSAWLYQSKHGIPGDLARALSESPLLLIDDLGQGEISDSFKRSLYSIINKRWEWERPIVVSTNLSSEKFRELFGDAIISRLSDGKIWKFEGKDFRLGTV